MASVPMFAPDGTLGDVPYEHMHDALAAGGKMGVSMVAPDGTKGVIPADKAQDALKAGGKVVPYDLSDQTPKQGFLSGVGSELKGMAQGVGGATDPTNPGAVMSLGARMAQDDSVRQQRGYSAPYRVAAAVGQGTGIVNPSGMEDAAQAGDAAGVLGHAAPSVALAASPLLAEGAARLGGKVLDALPNTKSAGANFKAVSDAAGQHTVALTPDLTDSLLRWQELVDNGGSRNLTVSKLMKRLSDPKAGFDQGPPITYDEARDFYSNISNLSADDAVKMKPAQRFQLNKIKAALGDTIGQTADDAGMFDQYHAAMKEYAQAKKIQAVTDTAKDYAIKGAATAAGGALLHKIITDYRKP